VSTDLVSSANVEGTVMAETSYFSTNSRRFELAQGHSNVIRLGAA